MKLASFDIFDTTLIRQCGNPEMVFYLLAYRLYPNDKARRDDFLLWRKQAEKEAYSRIENKKELTIDDIYDSPRLIAFRSEYSKEELKQAEIQMESEQLTFNPQIKALITQKRNEGYTICFISDMYLSSSFLRQILQREGCLEGNELVYVSCEMDARKSNGKLFDLLRQRLAPTRWEHYGDHPISDVKNPRRKGLKASIIRSGFTEIEDNIIKASEKSEYPEAMQLLAGIQRCARIKEGNTDVVEIAADFIAPAYIPYVRFVMEQAMERGVRKLYFLSRDSYILLEIANAMKNGFPDLELSYLFVSRKALLLPYLHLQTTAKQFLSIQDKETIYHRTVNSLLTLLHTNTEELKKLDIQFSYKRIESKQDENDFLNKIFSSHSAFLPLLKERCAKEYALLRDYFIQEGLCGKEKCGMVDVGWQGTTRRMINQLQRSLFAKEVDFFYYGVRYDVMSVLDGNYITFFAPWQLNTKLTSLIENYFSTSPYPSTIGYVRNDCGEIHPMFVGNSCKQETELTKFNNLVVCKIVRDLMDSKINVNIVMRQWMSIVLDAILNLSVQLPLSAFLKAEDFDTLIFVRRLSVSELFYLCCLGKRITAFDRASLKLTVGNKLFPLFLQMSIFSEKIRWSLYLKMKKKRI